MSTTGEGVVMHKTQAGSPGFYGWIMQNIEFYRIFCYNFRVRLLYIGGARVTYTICSCRAPHGACE